jgi:hypothetical protein
MSAEPRPGLPRAARTAALLGAIALLAALQYAAIYFSTRIVAPPALDPASQTAAARYLRAVLDGATPEPTLPRALEEARLPGPLFVTLYLRGERLLRHESSPRPGSTAASALREARRALLASPATRGLTVEDRRRIRIKVDLVLAEGPIAASIPILFAVSVVPGLDGIGLEASGRTARLLPDDLFRKEILSGYRPFFFMGEFQTGLDVKATKELLADELGMTAEAWRSSDKRYFRFRVQSFVESLDHGRARPIVRYRAPIGRLTRASAREAVLHAADYVLRLLRPDGKFEYIYYPLADTYSPPEEYALPRHAGTTWFLSLAYKALREPRILDGAKRAISYLAANAVPPSCTRTPFACIGTEDEGDLGSAALGIVAIAEYESATGDTSYRSLLERLGGFLLFMQKPNGDFCHQYTPRTKKKNCEDILLYYSGEAALGLAKIHERTHQARYVRPLERAIDFLVGENYDFFLGQFFISEDHWTCIAAEAALGAVHKPEWARFCYAFAELNRRAQVSRADPGLVADLEGSFNITPFFMPHNTPVGSRTESNVATYLLSQRLGQPQPLVLETTLLGAKYLVDQQLKLEDAYLFPRPEAAEGGMMQTPVRASIRIDYVQHAYGALARALPLIPE